MKIEPKKEPEPLLTSEELETLNWVIKRAENGIDMGGGIGFLHPDIKAAKRVVSKLAVATAK